MPSRSLRGCAAPGCPNLTSETYCAAHKEKFGVARGTRSSDGYGGAWRKIRDAYLSNHPTCANPYQLHGGDVPATEVDHIIARRKGGSDDPDNLQALCKGCHSRKTALEDNRWGGGRKSLPPYRW